MTDESLTSALESVVAATPQRTAIRSDAAQWTYADLWRRSGAVAAGLLGRLGAVPGSRIGILGDNDTAYLAAYFGVLRAGCVAVPLNQFLLAHELVAQLRLVDATACLVGTIDGEVVEAVSRALPTVGIDELLDAEERALPEVEARSDATVLLTSGTTGTPKGAVQTHATMRIAAAELQRAMPYADDDVMLCFLPLFASIPEQILPSLFAGLTLEVLPRFDLARVEEACTRATTLDAVPTLLARILDGVDHQRLAHLRWLFFASEPMPPALLRRWTDALPNVAMYEFYGMTEMLTITFAPPGLLREAPESVGRPFPGSRVAVVDGDGRPLPAGESGEVVCASPARMRGYLPEGIDPRTWSLTDGSMRTGDAGHFDEDGRLFLTGRIKDLIISGGLNIVPVEIERVAVAHPDVTSAAVVGVPDERWGETPVLLALRRPGAELSAAELLDWCRERLAGYKRPRAAAIVEQFPMTGIGKISKGALRDEIISGRLEIVRG
jgi:acyl-CoA synthetase (AMP-forming)/AMP-acid ligase II